MSKTKYHVDIICPRCGIQHNDVPAIDNRNDPYTGTVKPRFFCKRCIDLMQGTEWQQQIQKGTKKGLPITFLGLSVRRGITKEYKAKYDQQLELMGRKFREKWGIIAPASHWYVKG